MLTIVDHNQEGFISDSSDFLSKFRDYYSYALTTQAGRSMNCDIWSNTCDLVKKQIFRWVWSHLYTRLPPETTLKVFANTANYRQSELDNGTILRRGDRVNSDALPPNAHTIEIVYLKTGLKYLDYLKEQHPDAIQRPLITALTQDRYHHCMVFKADPNKVVIYTNRFNMQFYFRLLGLLPSLFTDMQPLLENELTKTLLQCCFNMNLTDAEPYMIYDTQQLDKIRAEANARTFITALEKRALNQATDLAQAIKTTQSNVESIYEQLFSINRKLLQQQAEHAALMLDAQETLPTELTAFILKTNAIRYVSHNASVLTLIINTPITNYRRPDVQMWFKSQYNVITENKKLTRLIKDIFIRHRFNLHCSTKVDIPFPRSDARWNAVSASSNSMGNTHMVRYNCYTTTKAAVTKALSTNDYLTAFSALISCCATLVFTDVTVISRLANDLTSSYANAKIIVDRETKKFYTPDEIFEYYESTPEAEADTALDNDDECAEIIE